MNEKAAFSGRLKLAMANAGYPVRPVVLEREFNIRYWGRPITVQAVRRWLRGEAIPAQDKLQILAEWLQVEPQALRFGEQAKIPGNARKKRWDEMISGPEREVFEAFLDLPAEERKAVRTLILALGTTKRKPDSR
ncbi:MAG: transcriptional regulator [Candidatus Accumulibacter sp.]|jgi:transcriptional regulator with XRE-family HTH domain|nr:transcriptional regulator [Accumulibacter sp.]